MATKDPRVDAYVARAAPFARPILAHIRALVHGACPAAVETIKWGMPHFEHHGILCGMAAFKAHCAFGLWRRDVAASITGVKDSEGMGQFGRLTRLSDLPSDAKLRKAIREAAALNEAGVRQSRAVKAVRKPPIVVPAELASALAKNTKARATFEGFSDSHKREYVEWIAGAKREQTRDKRVATALEWLAQGKTKEWRYRGA